MKNKQIMKTYVYISEIAVNQENVNVREQLKFEIQPLCLLYYTYTLKLNKTKQQKHTHTPKRKQQQNLRNRLKAD